MATSTATKTTETGLQRRGVETATHYLEKSGYEIREKNWRCQAGAVDIICQKNDTIVFVQVDTRTNANSGWKEEKVDDKYRTCQEKIALAYLSENEDLDDNPLRFDKILIVVLSNNRASIRHHLNAL